MSEKRVWIASILSAIILVVYAQFLTRWTSSKQTAAPPPTSQKVAQERPAAFLYQLEPHEEIVSIESQQFRLEVGKVSTAVRSVVLKNFQNLTTRTPLAFVRIQPALFAELGDEQKPWVLVEQGNRMASWQRHQADGLLQELVVELDEKLSVFTLTLTSTNQSGELKKLPIRIVATWGRDDELSGRYNLLEAVLMTERQRPWQRTHLRYMEGANQPKNVPRRTSLITLSERYFCQSIKPDPQPQTKVSLLPAPKGSIAVSIESSLVVEPNKKASSSTTVYVGPRDFFSLREAGFEHAFALGFLGQIGLMLMLFLKGIAAVVHNYGAAIILLAGLVTVVLSPFTLISFRSMKKLQQLQPKIEQLKKKHERDPKRMNRELMALFREHRVSPLSGCLPMLLQLPVFFALWSAISHVIELRGEPFLWIKDLSLPDRLAKLPFGFDLNLLPILMTIAMYVQTKASQSTAPTTGMNVLSGPMMSILFGVMFYQVPSSLVLYWLTNTLVSLLFYKLTKFEPARELD